MKPKFKPGDIVVWEEIDDKLYKKFAKVVDVVGYLYFYVELNSSDSLIKQSYFNSFEEDNRLYTAARFLTDEDKLELL